MKIKYRTFDDVEYEEIDVHHFHLTFDRLSETACLEYFTEGLFDCVSVENVCEVYIEEL